jgi:hypothetical protein
MNITEQSNQLAAISLPSGEPLEIVKKSLLRNSWSGLVMGIFYIIILIIFPVWQLYICFGIAFFFICWSAVESLILYRKMTASIAGKNNLEEMERRPNSIDRYVSIQQKLGMIFFPINMLGICILSVLGLGEPIESMQKPAVLIVTLILVVISVPLCSYLNRLMYRASFEKYTGQLKENIRILKERNGG